MQDATSLAGAIAAGAVSAPEVMKAALAAAKRHAGLGALAAVDAALGRAGAARPAPGVFSGIPFLGKDLGSGAAGFPPAAGSPALRRRQTGPGVDSDLFTRFRAAGLVPFGLTTVPPFGLALTSDPVRNPFDPALSPGGSSGGAAAAVAAGIVAIAHATDAAGSIRMPAACCGLVGLKPSRGVVPQGPDFGNHLMGLAAELVLARSVRDVAAALAAVAGPMPEAPPLTRIALVLPDRCETLQNQVVREVGEVLRGLGCGVSEYPSLDDLGVRAAEVARTVLTASLAEWIDALRIPDDELPPVCAAIAAEGRAMPATRLFAASREMAVVTHLFWQRFSGVDAILSPVLSGPPPPVGAFDMAATDPDPHWAQMEAVAPNAALANVIGAPAIAVPMGASKMPASVQLLSRPRTDTALLALAQRLHAAAPPVRYPFPIAGHP